MNAARYAVKVAGAFHHRFLIVVAGLAILALSLWDKL